MKGYEISGRLLEGFLRKDNELNVLNNDSDVSIQDISGEISDWQLETGT